MDTRATFLRAPRILAELLKVICIVVLNLFIAVILAIGSGEAPIELWATPVIVVAGGEIILLQRPGWLPPRPSQLLHRIPPLIQDLSFLLADETIF